MDSLEALVPEPQAGLGEGLLLGVKSALGDELEQVFRRTGIIHIVVLSGYNVMLVVIFVMTILSYFLAERGRLIFGVLAIASFALMVGLSATVVRASIMAVLILIARTTGRSYQVLRALFFAGAVMLLINPYLLVSDPGFQLSFVATFGLILLAPHLEMVFHKVPNFIKIREFLVATIATQIFVLPLLLYQIGEFSVVSVLVNVLVLPMVPVAMLLTFFTGVIGLFSSALALPVAYLTHLSLSYILVVATWFAALPFAAYVLPPFPFWIMILAYVALGFIIWKIVARKRDEKQDEHIALEGWTIEDEINKKEMAELSQGDNSAEDNSATVPIFFR
jgi:competence protein ComEC